MRGEHSAGTVLMILVRDIKAAVCREHGLPIEAMTSPDRSRAICRPRQEAMCLARRLTHQSTVRIGQLLARDHSTVIVGARRIEQRCKVERELRNRLRRLTLELNGR